MKVLCKTFTISIDMYNEMGTKHTYNIRLVRKWQKAANDALFGSKNILD